MINDEFSGEVGNDELRDTAGILIKQVIVSKIDVRRHDVKDRGDSAGIKHRLNAIEMIAVPVFLGCVEFHIKRTRSDDKIVAFLGKVQVKDIPYKKRIVSKPLLAEFDHVRTGIDSGVIDILVSFIAEFNKFTAAAADIKNRGAIVKINVSADDVESEILRFLVFPVHPLSRQAMRQYFLSIVINVLFDIDL